MQRALQGRMIRPVNLGQRLVRASLAAAIAVAAARFEAAEPPFVDAADTTGLAFTHHNGAAGKFAIAEVMGAGVALLDYDNDDDLDVWLVRGRADRRGARGTVAAVPERPRRRRVGHAARCASPT